MAAYPPHNFVSAKELAGRLNCSTRTLYHWAKSKKQGPPFTRYGLKIFYDRQDIEDWLASKYFRPPDARA